MTDHKNFIEVWNSTPDPIERAKKLGVTPASARTIAWTLRRAGFNLKRYSAGRKKVKTNE